MSKVKNLIFIVSVLIPFLAGAQRLPDGAVPQHYNLAFTPDLAKATFTGEETIDVLLLKPSACQTCLAASLCCPRNR